MRKHRVKQGECMDSIALLYGFPAGKVLYEHSANAELRKKRPDPGMLMPGDEVAIPDKKKKEITVKAGKEHRFEIKLPRRKLKLTIRDGEDRLLAQQPWAIEDECGQALDAGVTDGQGRLEAELPASADRLSVHVAGIQFRVVLGALDPLGDANAPSVSGVAARLRNLGFDPGSPDEEWTTKLADALAAFQRDAGVSPTGAPNAETLDKLREEHGS